MTSIVMVLMIGPFLLFSDLLPGLITENPVLAADIKLSFVLNKTVYTSTTEHMTLTTDEIPDEAELLEKISNGELIATNRSTPYLIYENTNPFFREYDAVTW